MQSRVPLPNRAEIVSPSMGRYEILGLLSASGGSALIYHAARKSDRQLVVLKELYPLSLAAQLRDAAGNAQPLSPAQQRRMARYVDAFSAEARKNRLLQKEFGALVVPGGDAMLAPDYAFSSSDAFQATNGMWYIEICTGHGTCLGNKAYLSLDACLIDLLKLCEVVGKLHGLGHGCLHLDLKPDNLFINSAGELKLLDFGSMLPDGAPHPQAASYTPGFSAPELHAFYRDLMAQHPPTAGSDCYSIAAIFYWMLFGRALPEEKLLYTSEIDLNLLDGADFPEMLRGHSCKTIVQSLNLLKKGLSFSPKDRYQSIAELQAALHALLDNCRQDLEDISPVTGAEVFVRRIASEKTVLFVSTSAVNPALNCFVNIFYGHVFKQLFEFAESRMDGRLPIPVHVLCDDFATGSRIQNFSEYISVFREKGISVTLLLQSESQLEAMYGSEASTTILNNCDSYLYLGGMDLKTARNISIRTNRPLDEILYMPIGREIVFRRGQYPVFTDRYRIAQNPLYKRITRRYAQSSLADAR